MDPKCSGKHMKPLAPCAAQFIAATIMFHECSVSFRRMCYPTALSVWRLLLTWREADLIKGLFLKLASTTTIWKFELRFWIKTLFEPVCMYVFISFEVRMLLSPLSQCSTGSRTVGLFEIAISCKWREYLQTMIPFFLSPLVYFFLASSHPSTPSGQLANLSQTSFLGVEMKICNNQAWEASKVQGAPLEKLR